MAAEGIGDEHKKAAPTTQITSVFRQGQLIAAPANTSLQ